MYRNHTETDDETDDVTVHLRCTKATLLRRGGGGGGEEGEGIAYTWAIARGENFMGGNLQWHTGTSFPRVLDKSCYNIYR